MKKYIKDFFKKYFTKKNIIIFSVVLVIFTLLVLFGPDTTIEYDWLRRENGIGYHTINSNHVQMTCTGNWLNESVYAYVGEHGLGTAPYKYTLKSDSLTLFYAEDYVKDKKHPASLTITYLSDQATPVKDQALTFALALQSKDNYKFISEEETTWEDVGRYYYLHNDDHYADPFPSYEWDIVVWKYEYIDKSTNQKCETLFFERADGFYTIDMKYPRWGKDVKEEMYTLFEVINFQIDLEIDQQMENALSCTTEKTDGGKLIVTVTYDGEVTIDSLYCQLESFSPEGSNLSASFATTIEHDVKPGETVVFTFDARTVSDFENIKPRVFAAWNAHSIEDGHDTAY